MTIQEKIEKLEEKQAELVKEIKALKHKLEKESKGRYDWVRLGVKYYWTTGGGTVRDKPWKCSKADKDFLSVGNIFKTREEAEFELERLKVIHELKEFSRPFKVGVLNFYIAYHATSDSLVVDFWRELIQCDIHFKNKEIAQQAIETVGEDRIKKYYFRVED